MADFVRSASAHPAVLMFGPLSLSCNPTQVARVRKAVVGNAHSAWILSIISQLPQVWKSISTALPSLHDDTGYIQVLDLAEAFRLGRPLETSYPLPNKVLVPLVVIYHLAQYIDFLGRTGINVDETYKSPGETIGFCTGLLSAFAVATSENKADFERYGAVAIRLSLLVGMVVDAREASSELNVSKSLRVGWNSTQSKEEMMSIIREHPNTYASVEYDENLTTVTTTASNIRALDQQLKNYGFMSSELELYGRFHAECHRELMAPILEFCDSNPEFQFPDASKTLCPTRSNSQGQLLSQGSLHHHALHSILTNTSEWHQTLTAARQSLVEKDSLLISFGFGRCVPPTHMRVISHQVVHLADVEDSIAPVSKDQRAIIDNDIAVVGMSCKVAGADNLEEFWDILCAAKSQHREVPQDRIAFKKTAFRDVDEKRKWFANLIDGPDKFDHKFFKKSPRESATMDPQQRLLLQTAYQAVEHSGYFRSPEPDRRVGCYIGLCATDYENNVACHAANAFSATGNLQGFVAGKVSHYFGWTGPGLTIDTACSSSAVAVHQACRAIISGECTAALAGGTHVMTSPLWFQNLAGASFLSTTGQCKPFDAKADGYCRGEGVGVVFLKKLSAAVADGDQILGVVAATGVQQNQNCTPIFVPNVPSLSNLFSQVTTAARLKPGQISVVEAHGTGTAVGDPAEYDSIRQVLGGPIRSSPLVISSVKGLVGHVECTSGIISMIKVLLMMNKGAIPPQASFTTINPAIKATLADNMNVPTSLLPWDADFRAALINNYGASGSNASIVITESPLAARHRVNVGALSKSTSPSLRYPFWLCGFDDQSLRRYTKALTAYLNRQVSFPEDLSIANISYNLAIQTNRGLDQRLVFSAESLNDLQQKLVTFQQGGEPITSTERVASKSVVLCFGGQVSTYVGLDRQLYESIALLRKHLDDVDAVARSLGIESIFPVIFERSPITNIVKLQTALFASQYACARSWIDSGVQPSAVVGHSFGELTALCVSQVLSVKDTLKMIISRATLIQDAWGPEKGAMMAVESELPIVEKLLADVAAGFTDSSKAASIACYNGPKSFTLAGSEAAIDAVADAVAKMPKTTSSIRVKKLNVTNAFHCALVDPLMARLEENAQDLTFREPKIPIERATEFPMQEKFTAKFVSDHMRQPVYFNHALQRLAQRYSGAVFLEAGSSSTVTSMASKALGNPSESHFQAINITSDNGWNNLVDATVGLWKAGLTTQFWAHCAAQSIKHTPLLLPPYQFDESRHWLELKSPPQTAAVIEAPKAMPIEDKLPDTLLTFLGYQDSENRLARFRINTMISLYDKFVVGHVIAQTAPICPSIVQLDLVIEAVRSVHSEIVANLEPQIQLVENQSPLCINAARQVFIETEEKTQGSEKSWSFQIFSTDGSKAGSKSLHTTGKLEFRAADDVSLRLEFARLERFMNHRRYTEMMSSGDVDEILSHRNIYNIFSEIVEYSDEYRGLQKLVAHGSHSAGYVTRTHKTLPGAADDAFMTEAVCQVGGIYVNCMTGRSPSDIFLATGIERWIRSPKAKQGDAQPEAYHVLASHHQTSDKTFLTDVFVYDVDDGSLVEAILGVSFVKVAKLTMQKLLTRLSPGISQKSSAAGISSSPARVEDISVTAEAPEGKPLLPSLPPMTLHIPKAKKGPPKPDVTNKVMEILVDLSGLEMHEIKPDSLLPDLGIDSLMGMEMAHEIEGAFKITLPESELMEIIDIPSLIKCVQKAVGVSGASVDGEDYTSDGEDSTSVKSDDRHSVVSSSHGPSTGRTTPQVESELDLGAELKLPFATVMEAFNETKALTDERIAEYGQTNYVDTVMPLQTKMCIALTLEAFAELGVVLRDATPNQKFQRITHPKEHSRLVEYLYKMLAEAQLIVFDDTHITRTGVPYPAASSKQVLEELLQRFPDQNTADKLTFYTGSNLAQVLLGKTDGIKLVFGTPEGRELVSGLYGEWPLNRIFYRQMEDFLSRLASKLHPVDGPLKILEMGAGTGGTTRWLVPLLATLDMPVEYTFTDLAPSFVAAARKKFKPYPFMKFRTHDIEKAPAADLEGTQHIIIASNAVHATHSLCGSTANMRKLLRPDGFLMMLEMTGTLYWVDMIFGLFEGWWFFDDGRTHAVTNETRWEKDLQSVGYGHVDWTDGQRPENKKEKLIIAMASGPRCERLEIPTVPSNRPTDLVVRQATVNEYVRQFTHGFDNILEGEGVSSNSAALRGTCGSGSGSCVVVTGATGSLGSHIVANLANRTDVAHVICLNRRNKLEISAQGRQLQALTQKGISLPQGALDKLRVFETDLSKTCLGLSDEEYNYILDNTTHIIHNAWLMNAKWPIKRFEPQLQIMRNLLDVAGIISSRQPAGEKFTFQFVSSIATVGHWPIWTGNPSVPEERMSIESVLPTGYGDAKYVCELMLDATLHQHPARFRAMVVRPGQIAGSSTSGYWNPMEHLSFLCKSSQTLGALPALSGPLSWTPVDAVAGTLADLLATDKPYPVYHIDNPIRQPWPATLAALVDAMGINSNTPGCEGVVVPLDEWIRRVKERTREVGAREHEGDNPAILLVDFLEDNFVRMSCGGLLLDTARAREHSRTLAGCGPVGEDLVRLYVRSWREMGFLR
ncbi:putative polyketide synthase [Hypoxylon argillaceum]|nr:putative polyketide synthase [Hypoxylon argillaceum]